MWDFKIETTRKNWIDDPRLRWNEGLNRAGFNFRTGLSRAHYPPIPPSGFHRAFQTADKANFEITDVGVRMEFGATFYLAFLLYGTRFMMGWLGKEQELFDLMERGFRSGIAEYSG